jgi:hypothetical protein
MKKLFTIIFILISITSLLSQCQNNIDQRTKTALDNVANLKKRLDTIPLDSMNTEKTNLSVEQITQLLLVQQLSKDSKISTNIATRKKSHQQLQVAVDWFEQPKEITDWIDYLAVHSQMFAAIEYELNQLKLVFELHDFCKEIGEKIIRIFINTIIQLHDDEKVSKNDAHSLIHAYQDYAKLFENYVQINDLRVIKILQQEGLI